MLMDAHVVLTPVVLLQCHLSCSTVEKALKHHEHYREQYFAILRYML